MINMSQKKLEKKTINVLNYNDDVYSTSRRMLVSWMLCRSVRMENDLNYCS